MDAEPRSTVRLFEYVPRTLTPAANLRSGFVLALLLAAPLCPVLAFADSDVPHPTRAQLLLEAGEFDSAVTVATEDLQDADPPSRVENLTILGDAHFALGQLPEAVGAYELARSELRVHGGLHTLDEVELLLREAAALTAARETKEANERHEYAYTIRKRESDKVDFVDATVDLANWYESNRFLSAARDLYRTALDAAQATTPDDPYVEAQLHGAIARTYRAQYFPDLESQKRHKPRKIALYPHGNRWRNIEYLTKMAWTPDYRRRGLVALKRSVNLLETSAVASNAEVNQRLLELGDWFLLMRKANRAVATYRKMEVGADGIEDAALAALREPELLSIVLPKKPVIPSRGRTQGQAEFEIAVNDVGTVRHVKLVRIEPSYVDPLPYRIALRKARFRPAVIDGKARYTRDVNVVLDFDSDLNK